MTAIAQSGAPPRPRCSRRCSAARWVALFYAWHPALAIEFDRDLPRNVSGVYPPERDDTSGLTFAWTGADVVAAAAGSRSRQELDARSARPRRPAVPGDNPDVTILADGVTLATHRTSAEFQDIRVTIPARGEQRGLTSGCAVSKTFVPGPSDPRPLGVVLDRLSLTPDGIVLVPRAGPLSASSGASAAMGAAIALLGVTAGSAIGGAVLLSAGTAAVIARGFGPFTNYPDTVVALGIWIALVLAGAVAGGPVLAPSRFAIPRGSPPPFPPARCS